MGGGRKGLPASFLNRFVKVNYFAYDEVDYLAIANYVEPSLDITEHHKRIYPINLVAYLKYLRMLVCSGDVALTSNACLGTSLPVNESLLHRIVARDLCFDSW